MLIHYYANSSQSHALLRAVSRLVTLVSNVLNACAEAISFSVTVKPVSLPFSSTTSTATCLPVAIVLLPTVAVGSATRDTAILPSVCETADTYSPATAVSVKSRSLIAASSALIAVSFAVTLLPSSVT